VTIVDWEQLLEDQLRKLGTRTPTCRIEGCREAKPFALTGVDPDILCYEHRADLRSRPWLESHHPAGRHNGPVTVELPGNEHRILSGRQESWPRETLRNRDGSPLLKAAATLRGWLDVLWLIQSCTVGWIPELLEQLDAWLRVTVGERWWDELGWRKP
jgi:hypothetical protein